jgi:hypothetical protein
MSGTLKSYTYDRTREEARASVLAYFSDKSTAHAIFLLTAGLIAVSIVTLPIQRNMLLVLLSVTAAVSVYIIYRMLYWGKLSNRVLSAPPDEEEGRPLLYALYEGALKQVEKESWAWRASQKYGLVIGFGAGMWMAIILAILSKYGFLFVESH